MDNKKEGAKHIHTMALLGRKKNKKALPLPGRKKKNKMSHIRQGKKKEGGKKRKSPPTPAATLKNNGGRDNTY